MNFRDDERILYDADRALEYFGAADYNDTTPSSEIALLEAAECFSAGAGLLIMMELEEHGLSPNEIEKMMKSRRRSKKLLFQHASKSTEYISSIQAHLDPRAVAKITSIRL